MDISDEEQCTKDEEDPTTSPWLKPTASSILILSKPPALIKKLQSHFLKEETT